MATKKQPIKRLTIREKRYVEEMAKINVKTAKDAAINAGYSKKTAKQIAYENLTKPYLVKAIEKRRAEVVAYFGVTAEEIFGQAIKQMYCTMDDVIENGQISMTKATRTGAIHLVKEFTTSDTKYGQTIRVKLAPADEARQEIAGYMGLKTQDRTNPDTVQRAVNAINDVMKMRPDADRDYVIERICKTAGIRVDEVSRLLN